MKQITAIIMFGLLLSLALSSKAQEYDYTKSSIKLPFPPSVILDGSFKTYDIKLIVSSEVDISGLDGKAQAIRDLFEKDYLFPFAKLKQVDNNGDLHIFVLLQRFYSKGATVSRDNDKKVNGLNFKTALAFRTIISDRYGKQIFSRLLNQPERITYFKDNWSSSDIKLNQGLIVNTIIMEAVQSCTDEYEKKMTGGEASISINMAYLKSIKKYPEFKAMKTQAGQLEKELGKSVKAYIDIATQYVPDWEKWTKFNSSDDSNEVKRAAYQNLVNYYILNGNSEKATKYLQVYKPIDEVTKEMLGLVKYKSSEESEKLIALLAPQQEMINSADDGSLAVSKETNADLFSFYTLKGTVTIKDGKHSGEYTGTIKIKYPEPNLEAGSIVSLDATDASLIITYADASAQNKILNSDISKITAMKDSFGKTYQTVKFGSVFLGGSQYSLMKELFSSSKITTMKVIVPFGDDYLVKKNGDEKGVKSSLFNAKKSLLDYLKDCPAAVQMINSAKVYSKISMEQLGAVYTSCQ